LSLTFTLAFFSLGLLLFFDRDLVACGFVAVRPADLAVFGRVAFAFVLLRVELGFVAFEAVFLAAASFFTGGFLSFEAALLDGRLVDVLRLAADGFFLVAAFFVVAFAIKMLFPFQSRLDDVRPRPSEIAAQTAGLDEGLSTPITHCEMLPTSGAHLVAYAHFARCLALLRGVFAGGPGCQGRTSTFLFYTDRSLSLWLWHHEANDSSKGRLL